MCRFVITHKSGYCLAFSFRFFPFRRTDVPSSHYSQSEWVVHGSDVMSLIKNSQLDALERHSASHTAYEAPDASSAVPSDPHPSVAYTRDSRVRTVDRYSPTMAMRS